MDLKLVIILLACTVVAESGFFRDFSIRNPVTMDKEAAKFNFGKLRNLIPRKDLIKIPFRPRNHKNIIDLPIDIPLFDEKSNIVSYLKKISEAIRGKGVLIEDELRYIISGIDGNENIIPNKIKVIKEVFKKVGLPAREKIQLSKWILDLGGRENDLTNIDMLHKFISNIDGEGNTMEDFSNLTDWTSSLEGNVEMPFIGDLSNFLPRHDLDENLGTYFRKITDSLKGLGGNGNDISFIKDFNEITHKLNEHESKIPYKVAMVKHIFNKPGISMNTKAKMAQFMLNLRGNHQDIIGYYEFVDEMLKTLPHLQDLYTHIFGHKYNFSNCTDACQTIISLEKIYIPPGNKKVRIAQFLLEMGDTPKTKSLQDCLDDFVKTLQHFNDLFKNYTGNELYYSSCYTFCQTFSSGFHKHPPLNITLNPFFMQFRDQAKYLQSSSSNLILDHLGTAEKSLCSSLSGGRHLVSAYKDPENDCKVHCAYQNELEVLNSSDGWLCRSANDYKYGVCHSGRCVLEVTI